MSQLVVNIQDKVISQMFAYTAKHQVSFDEMTEKLWVDFLRENFENDLSISDEQEQILEQRYLAVQNGNAD